MPLPRRLASASRPRESPERVQNHIPVEFCPVLCFWLSIALPKCIFEMVCVAPRAGDELHKIGLWSVGSAVFKIENDASTRNIDEPVVGTKVAVAPAPVGVPKQHRPPAPDFELCPCRGFEGVGDPLQCVSGPGGEGLFERKLVAVTKMLLMQCLEPRTGTMVGRQGPQKGVSPRRLPTDPGQDEGTLAFDNSDQLGRGPPGKARYPRPVGSEFLGKAAAMGELFDDTVRLRCSSRFVSRE